MKSFEDFWDKRKSLTVSSECKKGSKVGMAGKTAENMTENFANVAKL